MAERENAETLDLLNQASLGDKAALGILFDQHRPRLRRMIEMRLDHRLQGRLDASDVLQDAYVEFSRSIPEYLNNPAIPLFLWMRFITGRKLQALHRHHLGTRMRAAGQEVTLQLPSASSECLALHLIRSQSTPSQAAIKAEARMQIQKALEQLEELDREVLSLRHFEQLSNTEASQVLNITEAAASKRYLRAMKRFRQIALDVIEDSSRLD